MPDTSGTTMDMTSDFTTSHRRGKRHRGTSVDSASQSRRVAFNKKTSNSLASRKRIVRSRSYDSRQDSYRSATVDRQHSSPHDASPFARSHIVCAISENLARETCIVSIDTSCPVVLNITKQNNGQNYAETMSCLAVVAPNEILMNEGRRNSPLAQKVMQHWKHREGDNEEENDVPPSSTVVKFISRAFFDQTKGADLLNKLVRKETYDSRALVQEYILLSSSHAVLHYTQKCLGLSFMSDCLDIRSYLSGGNEKNPIVVDIDRSTIIQLELLASSSGKGGASFFSAIDCTRTTVGNRLLRSTIMAPPCRLATIHARLELVETFLSNEQLFYSILKQLQNLSPIDKMLSDIAMVPHRRPRLQDQKSGVAGNVGASSSLTTNRQTTNDSFRKIVIDSRLAQRGIASLIGIKSTLACIPLIASTLKRHLESCVQNDALEEIGEASIGTYQNSLLVGLGVSDHESQPSAATNTTGTFPRQQLLLRGIISALTQPELEDIGRHISEAFHNTSYARNRNAAHHQECLALKSAPGVHGLMEMIRKAFLQNVDDIYKLADSYSEIHGFTVKVQYGKTRGWYLSIPAMADAGVPKEFIQPVKTASRTRIHCTTEEVQSLNNRAKDNVEDLLLMTHSRIQELLDVAREHYDLLARMSDAIALLDLCHGFADKVTLSQDTWVPPLMIDPDTQQLPDGHAILIRDGRCIVDESVLGTSGYGMDQMIVNDVQCHPSQTFTIISGVNGSGKSTYLKQVATIVLLAHCGSYIPAREANIPLITRLCARMGSTDDLENNISSFMKEMKETAYICKHASSRSLMLLDELGRETSNEDGVAIAWSVVEHLLAKGAMAFFATHYPQICRMDRVYPCIRNQHMEARMPKNENGNILYTHKIRNGHCEVSSDYGVHIAATTGFPDEVLDEAKTIESTVKNALVKRSHQDDSQHERELKGKLKDLLSSLRAFVETVDSTETLRRGLKDLKTALHDNSIDQVRKALVGGTNKYEVMTTDRN